MKTKITSVILCLALVSSWAQQQSRPIPNDKNNKGAAPGAPDKINHQPNDSTPSIYVWRINEISGDKNPAIRDTIRYNFQQTSLQEGRSIAVGYLGNVGSPSYSKLFFENGEGSDFYYWNALKPYYKTPGDQLFYNTKIPYSNLYYQSGGSQYSKEERLKGEITTNLGKNLNLGFNIDYIYSRGYYASLANKSLNYDLNASYSKDRYEMHAWVGNSNFVISENGGLSNDKYVTDLSSLNSSTTSFTSTDFPVSMETTWNTLKGRQIYMTNHYHFLGYYTKEKKHVNEKDTIISKFVPVASFVFTSQYTHQSRLFQSHDTTNVYYNNDSVQAIDTLYSNKYYSWAPKDLTTVTIWNNTFGLSMREGFRDWVKFGLTAYIQQTNRRYSLPDSIKNNFNKYVQNSVAIGGILSKTSGKVLRYDLDAQLSVAGYDVGQFIANGKLQTFVNFGGKAASLTANGYIKNLKANFLESNVQSKYFRWNKSMGDIRRVFVGGQLDLPQTGTKFSLGVENIQNYQYFNSSKKIDQYSGSVQVMSARLDQNLHAGVLHWDNQIAYQTTSNQSVIPLPELSVYSNFYILTKIAKVLTIQAGVDAHYHTTYYAPGYEPALMGFYNQQSVKIGGFPMSTIYVNAHLKRTRFFVMYYNVAKSVGNYGYFSMPHYPANPTIFKWGLSWDFDN